MDQKVVISEFTSYLPLLYRSNFIEGPRGTIYHSYKLQFLIIIFYEKRSKIPFIIIQFKNILLKNIFKLYEINKNALQYFGPNFRICIATSRRSSSGKIHFGFSNETAKGITKNSDTSTNSSISTVISRFSHLFISIEFQFLYASLCC